MNKISKNEIRIHITGRQGVGKTKLAMAIAYLVDAELDGEQFSGKARELSAWAKGEVDPEMRNRLSELLKALAFVSKSKIVITTSNHRRDAR